jgi:hypothetical protein
VYALLLFKVLLQTTSFGPISYQGHRACVEKRIKKINTAMPPCYFASSIHNPKTP